MGRLGRRDWMDLGHVTLPKEGGARSLAAVPAQGPARVGSDGRRGVGDLSPRFGTQPPMGKAPLSPQLHREGGGAQSALVARPRSQQEVADFPNGGEGGCEQPSTGATRVGGLLPRRGEWPPEWEQTLRGKDCS